MSDLVTMTLARKLQSEADAMVPRFNETGDVDIDAVERMEKLRHEIINNNEQGSMNSLMVFGCVRSVAAFLLGVAQNGDDVGKGHAQAVVEPDGEDRQTVADGGVGQRIGILWFNILPAHRAILQGDLNGCRHQPARLGHVLDNAAALFRGGPQGRTALSARE